MTLQTAISPSTNGSAKLSADAPLTSVYQSRDYDKFKSLNGNRLINLAHIKRLTESFQNNHLVCPIIVNEKYEIIDGQHRFMVCKELGLPICFIVIKNYGLKEVQIFNSNNTVWNKKDYLESYCQLGLRNYLEFKRFAAMFPDFQITVCGMLLSDRARMDVLSANIGADIRFSRKDFENGKFVVRDFNRASKWGTRIMDFRPHYKGYSKPAFVRALISVFKNKNYSHETMIKKLKVPQNAKIADMPNVKSYVLLLEDIFNYKNQKKVSIRYDG